MKVYMQELHIFITAALVKIIKAKLHHAEQAAKSQKFSKEVSVIIYTLCFATSSTVTNSEFRNISEIRV